MASPTTVGLQVLHKPTPRIAALPSDAIFARIVGVVDPALRGLIDARLDRRADAVANQSPHLLHEGFGIVEQAIDEPDAACRRDSPSRGASRLPVTFGG